MHWTKRLCTTNLRWNRSLGMRLGNYPQKRRLPACGFLFFFFFFFFANVGCVWSIIERVTATVKPRVIVFRRDVAIVKLGKGILFWLLQLVKYIWNMKAVVCCCWYASFRVGGGLLTYLMGWIAVEKTQRRDPFLLFIHLSIFNQSTRKKKKKKKNYTTIP